MYRYFIRIIILVILLFQSRDSAFLNKVDFTLIRNESPKMLDHKTRMDLAMEQEVARTKDPALGYVPRNRLIQSFQYTEELRNKLSSQRLLDAIPGVKWMERGPTNVGGRTRAIMIDPNDPDHKRVFSAGVSGGLWITDDITASQPVWESVNDFFDNMAITTIAYDPSNTQIMYFGTGEGYFNIDAVRGDGIWKSTDGGNTWGQLSATADNVDFGYVNKIVVTNSGTVLAACRGSDFNDNVAGGIQRSTDGGTSWTQTGTGSPGEPRRWAADLEIASNGDIYGSFGLLYGDGIFKSTDDGLNWSNVYSSSSNEWRIELAIAPSNANYIYALVQDGNRDGIEKIMRSTNGGSSWNQRSTPSWLDQDCGSPSNDFTRGQAWYDLIAAVDPQNFNTLWIGGIDLFRTTNGGSSWTQMTNWAGNCDYPEVHADQHAIIYEPGNSDVIYFGNDGGIYQTENATDVEPIIKRKEFNYNTTQFYSIAIHPDAGESYFIGGTQDNGSNKFTETGIGPVVEVTGGDGGFSHIDDLNPNFQFTSFTGLTFNRSTDGGKSFTFVASNNNGSFINPSDYDPLGQDMFASYSANRYAIWSNARTAGNSITSRVMVSSFNGGNVTAVTCSSSTAGKVWFGLDNGRVVLVTNAASPTASGNNISSGLPDGSISSIAFEEGNENHLLATYFNYGVESVWETTNGGSSWTSVEGNLPDMPVRWVLFNPNNSDQAIIATELGVWSTDNLNGLSTIWEPSNDGLANTRVDMLQLRSSDNVVVAATHGRGIFTSDIFTVENADFTADKKVTYAENEIQFRDVSNKSNDWFWTFGDGGFSTEQNPVHAYMNPGKYEVTLTINTGADTETKSEFIHILPNLGTPYLNTDGGNFESNPNHFGSDALIGGVDLWERGSPGNFLTNLNSGSNGWKTTLSSDITEADYQCALYTPSFNLTNTGTYLLSFYKSMESDYSNAPMGVQVQYSTDNGNNWIRLGSESDPDWYDKGPSTTAIETSVIHDRTGFNDDYNNDLTSYDISFLTGNATVAFRFVLFVDAGFSDGYNIDGFMIDDFNISGPDNNPIVTITDQNAGFAMNFDGTTGTLIGSILDLPETFTLETWINPLTSDDGQSFISVENTGNIFSMGYHDGGVEVKVGNESFSGGIKSDQPHHLAVIVEKSGLQSLVTVYRNGNLVWQQTLNDVIGNGGLSSIYIGQDGTNNNFFNGNIDEIKLYDFAKSDYEVRKSLYLTLNGQETGLIGYWQLNEGTGSITGNQITGNSLTLQSGTVFQNSTFPVGPGAHQAQININSDGVINLGEVGISLNFTGISGNFDLHVTQLNSTPPGTQVEDDYAVLSNPVKTPYWIIDKFNSGSFLNTSLTLNYGPGVLFEVDNDLVHLFKRESESAESWSYVTSSSTTDPSSGIVTFQDITGFSQFVSGESSDPLPVEYVSFEATWNTKLNSAQLSWITATEINNSHFIVERSVNALEWEDLSAVPGKGNVSSLNQYNFNDLNTPPMDIVFYRLKQVDYNGTIEHSEIRSVEVYNTDPYQVVFFPNPIKTFSSLKFYTKRPEKISIELINSYGQSIEQVNFLSEIGKNTLKFDILNTISDGTYYVQFETEYYKKTIRLLKKQGK